jgi:hypothetical protein
LLVIDSPFDEPLEILRNYCSGSFFNRVEN